jgi:hypothetical protein
VLSIKSSLGLIKDANRSIASCVLISGLIERINKELTSRGWCLIEGPRTRASSLDDSENKHENNAERDKLNFSLAAPSARPPKKIDLRFGKSRQKPEKGGKRIFPLASSLCRAPRVCVCE